VAHSNKGCGTISSGHENRYPSVSLLRALSSVIESNWWLDDIEAHLIGRTRLVD